MVAAKGRPAIPFNRRQIRIINGVFSIQKPISQPSPPHLPRGSEQPSQPQRRFVAPTHNSFDRLAQKNSSSSVSAPKIFPSFADLFKNVLVPDKEKGILPLPLPHTHLSQQGWTTVVRKRRGPKISSPTQNLPPSKPRRCFLCGDLNHMARSCGLSSFKCFKCGKIGHTSRACPPSSNPDQTPPPPTKIPLIPTSSDIRERIAQFSSFGILTLGTGSPSLLEVKEMLEFRFNVTEWNFKILRADPMKFFIEFPSSEMRDHAIRMGYIDFGSYGGTFGRWQETQGLKAYPKPQLLWLNLSGLPLHLWDADFVSELFKDFGEVYAYSRNLMFMEEIDSCKVLLKVKARQDVPSSIPFRYISLVSGWLLEGLVRVSPHGKPLPEEEINSEKGFHFLSHEGDSSTKFSWKDLHAIELLWESEVRRPLPPDPTPEASPPCEQQPEIDRKGKKVIELDSKGAGEEFNRGEPSDAEQIPHQPLQHPVATYPPLVKVTVEENTVFLPKDSWEAFLSKCNQGPQAGPSTHPPRLHLSSSPTSPKSISNSVAGMSTDAISSTAQPPGFERPRPYRIRRRRRRRGPLSISHLPYRRFMSGSSKVGRPPSKKGQSTSSTTPCLPINALSSDSLCSITANCGILPLSTEAVRNIKALEVERAEAIPQP